MQDYCWDSLASLYAFPAIYALRGLVRDYLTKQGLTIVIPKNESLSFGRTTIKRPIIVGAEAFFQTQNNQEVEPPLGGSTSKFEDQPLEKNEEILPIKVLSQTQQPSSVKLEEALGKISENLSALSQLQKTQLEKQEKQPRSIAPIIFQRDLSSTKFVMNKKNH